MKTNAACDRPSLSLRRSRARALAAGIAPLLAGAALWLPPTASAATGDLPATFWKGTTDGIWTGANWASDATGTPTTAIPTAADEVTFSISSGAARQTTTLGQNFTIHSLTISDPAAVQITSGVGGPFSLTISGAAGTGIHVNGDAGMVTIGGQIGNLVIVCGNGCMLQGSWPTVMSNVTLGGASDTITVNNAAGLLFTAPLAGSNGLKKEGRGTLTLANTSTYTGGTTVATGRLVIDNDGTTTFGTLGGGSTIVNGGTTNGFGGTSSGLGGIVVFQSQATAGSGDLILNGGTVAGAGGGAASFSNFSSTTYVSSGYASAGSAHITINGGTVAQAGGAAAVFYDATTADSASFTVNGSAVPDATAGCVEFYGTPTAGNATFNVNGGTAANTGGGMVGFYLTSTAGNATFNVNGGTAAGAQGGNVSFHNDSFADTGNFTAQAGKAGGAGGGTINFYDHAWAGTGTFVANGAAVFLGAPTEGGSINFHDNASADGATFIMNGGATVLAEGAKLRFYDHSTGGAAAITANGGTNGGAGGLVQFSGAATGTTGAVTVNGNGVLDISGTTNTGVSVGSLSGDGNVFLGSKNLKVGSSNQDTTLSGTIQNGGFAGGTGGSLTKTGPGRLTLSGTNTYTGPTTVNEGILQAGSTQAFGINSAVTVNAGAHLELNEFSNSIGSLSGSGDISNMPRLITSMPLLLAADPITLTIGGGECKHSVQWQNHRSISLHRENWQWNSDSPQRQ